MSKRRLVILGSTGSIGVNTLKVVAEHPTEFEVVGLATRTNVERLAEQVKNFRPKWVAVRDASRCEKLTSLLRAGFRTRFRREKVEGRGQAEAERRRRIPMGDTSRSDNPRRFDSVCAQQNESSGAASAGGGPASGRETRVLKPALNGEVPQVLGGEAGVEELAALEGVDLVVVAIAGAAALKPTLSAIRKGRTIGLANKETLVMAGELVIEEAKAKGATILPIDSEHSAIFQCLEGRIRSEVRRILLTGSGGPLKDIPMEKFGGLSKDQIMNHPRWKMGPKITVDSATMMNKALEVIEAHRLFGVPVEKIEVVVHPEAIVHSLVEFIDGSILAQLGVTDMRIPIQLALTYPKRFSSSLPALDLVQLKRLTFEAPNRQKFPCLSFGYEAAQVGGTLPAVLNAANEECVQAFLTDEMPFARIPDRIEKVIRRHRTVPHPTLREIFEADAWAREQIKEVAG